MHGFVLSVLVCSPSFAPHHGLSAQELVHVARDAIIKSRTAVVAARLAVTGIEVRGSRPDTTAADLAEDFGFRVKLREEKVWKSDLQTANST